MEYIKTGNIISGVFKDFSIDTSVKVGVKRGKACLPDGKLNIATTVSTTYSTIRNSEMGCALCRFQQGTVWRKTRRW